MQYQNRGGGNSSGGGVNVRSVPSRGGTRILSGELNQEMGKPRKKGRSGKKKTKKNKKKKKKKGKNTKRGGGGGGEGGSTQQRIKTSRKKRWC